MIAKKPRLVRVNRATWLTGRVLGYHLPNAGSVMDYIHYESYLLSRQKETKGMMCCLGFWCHTMGIPEKSMRGIRVPRKVRGREWREKVAAQSPGENHLSNLMQANDAIHVTDKSRERIIKRLGLKARIRFQFYGRYARLS